MSKFSTRAQILAGVAASVIAFPAYAQESAPPPAIPQEASPPSAAPEEAAAQQPTQGGLEEIVVTAQKRAENLQDVPIAVTALSGGQLASANVQGQIDLPKLTPNLNFTVNSGFASAYIRGVGTQFGNPGLELSVSVYLDDVYVPRASAALFAFGDIERIEVLKGPQGTLYGRNATGGAIRIITADPQPEFQGRASATVGSYQTRTFDGMINIPLSDGLAFRFAARHDENKGYVRNLFPGGGASGARRMQDRNEELYQAKLLWETGPLRVKISGDYSRKDDAESVAEGNLFPGAPEQIGIASGGCGSQGFYTICNDGWGYIHPKAYGVSARIDYDLGAATLSSISAYRNEHEVNCADIDGTGAPLQPVCGRPYTRQYTEEVQIASNGSGPLRYVAGVYYLRERSGYPFTVIVSTAPAAPLALQSTGEGVRVSSIAPYAQVDYDLSDQFSLSGGIRYTQENKKLRGNSSLFVPVDLATGQPLPYSSPTGLPECTPTSPPTSCSSSSKSADFNKLTWKATASYKPIDKVLLYATISRGFKSGGLNLPAFAFVDVVAPETLDDYEVGWKIETGNVRWNGAAFYYDYKDLQISITDQTTGGTRIKNAAGAKMKGVESDLTWVPIDQVELGVGGAFLDSKYKDFTGDAYMSCQVIPGLPTPTPAAAAGKAGALAQCASQGGLGLGLVGGLDLSGNRLVNAPRFSAYGRAQFTQDVSGIGTFTVGGVVNYRSTAYFDSGNLFTDKKRVMLSAKASWVSENDRYSLSVSGENLTDKKYFTVKSPQNLGGWRVVGAPRWFYFTAGVKF